MAPLDQVAVRVVSLAVGNENPEAFHHFAFYYNLRSVPVRLVPNQF